MKKTTWTFWERWIEAYEEVHYPMGNVSGVDMLVHLMEAREVTQDWRVFRESPLPLSTVSEILAGKRKSNVKHITLLGAILQGGSRLLHRPVVSGSRDRGRETGLNQKWRRPSGGEGRRHSSFAGRSEDRTGPHQGQVRQAGTATGT